MQYIQKNSQFKKPKPQGEKVNPNRDRNRQKAKEIKAASTIAALKKVLLKWL